ncbi:hypothetical protein [Streptomyces sp. LaPpAH-108]|uniref:hypothetical protein n=1 Tax=Streptomyces sp. LaPpAH-108 TaxID=1155714 RepID=UPI0003A5624D|nr:hypothetical protein [Streptomyces sp. LaPpAH-108]
MISHQVRVSGGEFAVIDGETVTAGPGGSVHDAVLDRLQRYAERRGAAVAAAVAEDTGRFVLEVSPDGSSRVLPSEASEETADTPEAPEVAPREPEPGQTQDRSAVAAALARARATAAARATPPAPPAPAPDPDAAVPPQLAEPVTRINTLARTGHLDEALAEATALRERLAGSAGPEHPHTLQARAVEAYLAHLSGRHREATVLALSVARSRCGAGDAQAPAEVVRAAAAWQRLDDERAAVVHGRELLHMWDRLGSLGPLPPGHAELAERVRGQVESLEAYA